MIRTPQPLRTSCELLSFFYPSSFLFPLAFHFPIVTSSLYVYRVELTHCMPVHFIFPSSLLSSLFLEHSASSLLDRCSFASLQMENVRRIRPLTGSLFLRFFLGRVNVRIFNDSERNKLRFEYHKFKDRTTIIYILFPLAMLLVQYFETHLRDSQVCSKAHTFNQHPFEF